jgi:hypothetical protein
VQLRGPLHENEHIRLDSGLDALGFGLHHRLIFHPLDPDCPVKIPYSAIRQSSLGHWRTVIAAVAEDLRAGRSYT